MAGTGPGPNPNSRRQTGNQAHTWTDLPAGGFDGPTPAWPLAAMLKVSVELAETLHERELVVWASIWRTPQAAAWSRNGWQHDVALYVRYLVLGETGDLDSAKEARMWSDRLGLNPAAMLKNRWRVARDEVAEHRAEPEKQSAANSARRRLKVADGAVAGS